MSDSSEKELIDFVGYKPVEPIMLKPFSMQDVFVLMALAFTAGASFIVGVVVLARW